MSNTITHEKIAVSPAYQFSAITPSDSVNLSNSARAIYVGTGGNISVHNSQGETILFKNVPDGTFLPVNTVRVLNTNTTASDIIVIY